MAIDLDGSRSRYFHERAKVEAQEGYPLSSQVTNDARRRLVREVNRLAWQIGQGNQGPFHFGESIVSDIHRVLGDGPRQISALEYFATRQSLEHFLTILEICAAHLYFRRRLAPDIEALQSILADDLSSFRFRDVGTSPDLMDKFQIHLIENQHLHREIVDRTFELTRTHEFKAAQHDYADAWRHYSAGQLDDALTNAHKALESACKATIKKVDPVSTPENDQLNALVSKLVALRVIPAQLTHVCGQLEQIFRNSGTLRNQAGTAHGSLDPTTPEASVALLGLRMSGTLISFLAERWTQMKPKS